MRSSRSAVAAAVAIAIAAGCRCEGSPPDAGTDVGADASVDGSTDAGRDVGLRDAGRDATDAWIDPDWRRVDGVPECAIEVAMNPEAVVPPLDVEPCPDREGCRRMDLPWRVSMPSFNVWSTWYDGTHGYVLVRVQIDPLAWLVVLRDDGHAVAVFRVPSALEMPCNVTSAAIGEGRIVLATLQAAVAPVRTVVVAAELDDAAGTARLVGELSQFEMIGGNFVQYVGVSRDVIALNLAPRHALFRMENDGAHREVASERLAADGAEAYLGPVIGSAILVERLGIPDRIEVSDVGIEEVENFVLPTRADADVSTPVFDGENLSWFQHWGRINPVEYEHVELMTSPWSRDSSALTPRSLGELEIAGPTEAIIAGGGYVLVGRDPTSWWSIRVSDGYRAVIPIPPVPVVFFPYAGPEEFVIAPRGTPREYFEVPYMDFVRYDSLDYAPP